MRTAYAKSGIQSRHVSNYTRQTITEGTRVFWKESVHCLRTFQYFAESLTFDGGKGAFELCHSFLYFVGTHFQIFIREFLAHLRTVYASPQKLARPLSSVRNELPNKCSLISDVSRSYAGSPGATLEPNLIRFDTVGARRMKLAFAIL